MSAHELALLLAVAGGVAVAALALEPIARSLGVPTPLAFLLGGLLLGEVWDGSHAAARPSTIAIVGTVALVVVLLQGGFVCGLRAVREQLVAVLTLGIAGTAATFGLVALAAHSLVGLSWTEALLLGAVLSPTDPAAVFAAVSRAGAGGVRVVRLLEAEAGFNDPVAIALTAALVGRRREWRDRRRIGRVDDAARSGRSEPWSGSRRASSRRACSDRAGPRSRWRRRWLCLQAGSRPSGSVRSHTAAASSRCTSTASYSAMTSTFRRPTRCARSASNSPPWPRSRCS